MTDPGKKPKKTVRVETGADETAAESGPTWVATPEAKKKALTLRLIAGGLWLVAIVAEVLAIVLLLRQNPFETIHLVLLVVAFVVIGALAIGGSLLWKKANLLDPASKKDAVRFFVQNQLGVIIAIVAFLPLIILVFTNKNMSGGQKAIAGIAGIVLLLVAGFFGASLNPPSVEQYTAESNQVTQITGSDLVYWTKSGNVFHLCEEARYVNLDSKDGTIYAGTVAEAHAAGKSMPSQQTIKQEAGECGFEYIEPAQELTETPEEPAVEETPAP